MQNLSNMYRPITGEPFRDSDEYCEVAPCAALRPYVRCFWGTKRPVPMQTEQASYGIVIPDTCMDIIFDINYTQNSYNGFFCTIDEHSYRTGGASGTDTIATFAIRFYAWTAILFSEYDLTSSKNRAFPAEVFFSSLKTELEPLLFDVPTLGGKIAVAEKLLLKRLCTDRIDHDVANSIHYMLSTSGRAKISDICAYTAVSERKLERIFNYNIGVSPKTFSSLLRYQLLWQEMLFSRQFEVLDAVEKFGYTDQAHLLNDFRKRHFMSPKEAVQFALKSR